MFSKKKTKRFWVFHVIVYDWLSLANKLDDEFCGLLSLLRTSLIFKSIHSPHLGQDLFGGSMLFLLSPQIIG
jgi:hypothetical protein